MNSQVLIDRVFLQDLLFLIKQPRTKIDARAVLVFGIERALATPAPIPDHSEDVRAMVLPDGYKVAAWCMTDFQANVTVSPEVCARWHRQLFNVSPLYLLAARPSAKGGE